jgi:hypothetical protein
MREGLCSLPKSDCDKDYSGSRAPGRISVLRQPRETLIKRSTASVTSVSSVVKAFTLTLNFRVSLV